MIRKNRLWVPEAPHLILNPFRESFVELPRMGCAGKFTVELVHSRTGEVAQRLEFNNIITNAGLDLMAGIRASGAFDGTMPMVPPSATLTSSNYPLNWCGVGTGSNVPAFTDTALQTQTLRTNEAGGFAPVNGRAGDNSYSYTRITKEFTESQANANLTEVGFFDASTGGIMFTRQLFKDGAGNPVTVTKTSDFRLRVIYEFRVYPIITDTAGSITVNGGAVSVTFRPYEIDDPGHWNAKYASYPGPITLATTTRAVECFETQTLAATTSSPSGSAANPTSHQLTTPVAGNYYNEYTSIFMADKANFATGIGLMTLGRELWTGGGSERSMGRYQASLATKITKTSTDKLTVVHRTGWTRHTIP
jgi:hypothetical protein